jgi:cysteine desulfurase
MAYFDHNATAPLTAAARAAWLQAQDDAWQNPASGYRSAARVKALMDRERERLAQLLECAEHLLVFTSGATEGANAVWAHLAAREASEARVLLNPTEHSCVLAAAQRWFPGRVEYLPVDACGVVERAALQERLALGGVAAVAVMAANNETGVIQPWRELAADCRAAAVPYFCDAVQWLGRLPGGGLGGADFVIGSAHKFGGPKGVGFLKLPGGPPGRGFASLLGGGQQGGRRSGTEDYPGVAAMVAALAEAEASHVLQETVRLQWRSQFEAAAQAALPGIRIVGSGADRLWNTVLAIMPSGGNARWLTKLDRRGFQVSTTAACASAQGRSSAVLAALGVPADQAQRALRFSAGWATRPEDWRALLASLVEVAREIEAGSDAG